MGRKSNRKKQNRIFEEVPPTIALKIVSYLCLAIGFASFWGISQFHFLDNTRNGVGFFFLFAFLGLLMSIPIYAVLYRVVPDLRDRKKINVKWKGNINGLRIGFFFLIPGIASYVNRTHLVGEESCNEYMIIEKSKSNSKSREHYLFVDIDNYDERLTIPKTYWETVKEGQSIKLCLQKGVLGFENIKIEK